MSWNGTEAASYKIHYIRDYQFDQLIFSNIHKSQIFKYNYPKPEVQNFRCWENSHFHGQNLSPNELHSSAFYKRCPLSGAYYTESGYSTAYVTLLCRN
jgi:hypothetical protein